MAGLFGKTTRTYAELLKDISAQTSSASRCIPVVYGTARVAANLIYYGNFHAEAHRERTGKGGGGSVNINYSYNADVILALCEGPAQFRWLWVDKEIYSSPNAELFYVAYGNADQKAWEQLPKDKEVHYPFTAYIAKMQIDLGDTASLKNHSVEVVGFMAGANDDGDANPADVLMDMLTNATHGMGFPAASVAPLDDYRLYAKEAGFLVSAALEGQNKGIGVIKALLGCTNSVPIWSGGKLRVLPLDDLPVGGWTPNSTPLYALTHDDFLSDGPDEDPVEVTRKPATDTHNQVRVKYRDRAPAMETLGSKEAEKIGYGGETCPVPTYAEAVAEANDPAMQDLYGLRQAPEFSADFIANRKTAQLLAQTMLQRSVGVRNEYRFRLGWRYTLLEPGDLVTLTEPGLGLADTPVRIVAVEEDADGDLTITAEDWPSGIATAVAYPAPDRDVDGMTLTTPPGDCNPPVIFEPPADLTGGRLQIMVGTSGCAYWGGCEIHAAREGGTYALVGRIDRPARHGATTAALTAADDDAAVDLSVSGGTLMNAQQADADKWETLSYLDGELVSFQDANPTGTPTAPNRYSLTNLRRGLFSTAARAHPAGSKFMRLDGAVAALDFNRWNKEDVVLFKFPSFNIFGQATQGLHEVEEVRYTIAGTGLETWAAPSGVAIAIGDAPS